MQLAAHDAQRHREPAASLQHAADQLSQGKADPAQLSATLSGADRTQKLYDGAKKEGQLNIYTSAQTDDMGALVKAFEAKYGIKVSVWRSSSEKVLQRAIQEARAGRAGMDVAETNGPELESMSREKVLQKVASPHHKDLIEQAIRPHGEWVGTRLNVFVQAYNTNAVKPEALPKSVLELTEPKWKGRVGFPPSTRSPTASARSAPRRWKTSRKSPPIWNGPRNMRYIRNVSAPQRAMYSSGTTTFPRDFDIFAPSFTIRPCARKRVKGSSKSMCPRSLSTMVMKRE